MRNDKRERIARTILAVFVAWILLFSGILGLGASLVAMAGEEPVEPHVDLWVNGTLTITGDAVLDGNLNIGATGNLTVLNGGISFAMDYELEHRYSLNIAAGGRLNLFNSYITVETDLLSPYYILPVDVAGTLYGQNAVLQFPGFVNVTGTMELWDSVVTSLDGVSDDDANDAPVFRFTGSSIGEFYRTSIGPLYTRSGINRNDPVRGYKFDFNITSNSDVWFVDTHLDIDYSTDNTHNEMWATDFAQVYAYNLTIDTSSKIGGQSAIRTSGPGTTARVSIMRWADVLCVDNDGVPIEGADLDPLLTYTGAAPQFPDSGGLDPHNLILTYLGKTAGNWKTTGPNGRALLPLPAEHIDHNVDQSQPNSEFYGQYIIDGTYQTLTSSASFSFNPYPALDAEDGTRNVVIVFDTLVPKPDLEVSEIYWIPSNPTEGDNVSVFANISNTGGSGAIDVWACFNVVGEPALNNSPIWKPFINASAQETFGPAIWVGAVGGFNTVKVVADCFGGISESKEGNNIGQKTMYVIPRLPDYNIDITFPLNNYIGNPVTMDIPVGNPGNADAPANTVNVYIGDPTIGTAQLIGQVPVGVVINGSANQVFFNYTFDRSKDYKICAYVDESDSVPEAYEDNNTVCKILRIDPAPNLAVTSNDIGVGDPCTRIGQTVTPQAVVRNIGEVDAGAFVVDFYFDNDYFASGNSTGLIANATEIISADIPWIATEPGVHVLTVIVDLGDVIKESTNADNVANKDILIFHDKIDKEITGVRDLLVDFTYASNLDISGSLTIDGSTLTIWQANPLIGRYCIKILGTGSLILKNGADIVSNYPLVIYVTDSASLIADDTDLNLDVLGTGGIFADQGATIDIETSVLQGNIFSTGYNVSLKGVDLLGTDLYIEAASTSNIWDVQFTGIQNLYLFSDDGDVNTVDFDIRNVTDFSQEYLDEQLVFKGNQLVELTNVETYIPEGENWHTGMITENAKGRLYWWLTTKMVDGTGAVLTSLTPELNLSMLDGGSLLWNPVYTGLFVPFGQITFRVLSEEVQYYPTWAWTNSTYAIEARVQVDGTWFFPDTRGPLGDWTGDVRTNMEVELRFSGLTPDLSVSMISFVGEGMIDEQPLDRPLQIQATIYNSGNIEASNVTVHMFVASELIGFDEITVPAMGNAVAIVVWTPNTIGAKIILVSVDFNNTIPERDESNNERPAGLTVFGWPDLSVNAGEILFATDPVEQTPGGVTATVRNLGTSNAVNAVVTFSDDDGWSDTFNISLVKVGTSEDATVLWTPTSAGIHALNVSVDASNADHFQTDYDQSDNQVNLNVLVLTLPDLYVYMVTGDNEVTVGVPYEISVTLNNSGGSTAWGVDVVLILDDVLPPVAQMTGMNITASGFLTITITCPAINDIGTHTISARVDPDRTILESVETNNTNQFTYEVVPPSAYITISSPAEEQTIKDGTRVVVEGWVKEMVTDRGIEGVELVLTLALLDGTPIGVEQYTVSKTNGQIFASFDVTDIDCEDEEGYNFVVSSNASYVVISYTGVFPEKCPYIWLTPELLLILIIIIIVVVIIAAITVYIKVFGLGKLVECGECGAFIPEDSTACPKCGVQFETETAKCSNCQAWIPVKVKKCPECGVEFATGEVEMEDYNKKMRMQYDEVKGKLKKEAQRELGKSLTHAEFEDWWKTQPTFVTFQQWLKQEEDMRKMGSKPCPSCGTLNSVTTTVCHKCGALMAGDEKPRRPPSRPPAEREPVAAVPAKKEAVTPSRPGGAQPPAEGAPPTAVRPVAKKTLPTVERPVPKKVIKKPVVEGAPTVVPKKVVRKPEEEDEESGGGY